MGDGAFKPWGPFHLRNSPHIMRISSFILFFSFFGWSVILGSFPAIWSPHSLVTCIALQFSSPGKNRVEKREQNTAVSLFVKLPRITFLILGEEESWTHLQFRGLAFTYPLPSSFVAKDSTIKWNVAKKQEKRMETLSGLRQNNKGIYADQH